MEYPYIFFPQKIARQNRWLKRQFKSVSFLPRFFTISFFASLRGKVVKYRRLVNSSFVRGTVYSKGEESFKFFSRLVSIEMIYEFDISFFLPFFLSTLAVLYFSCVERGFKRIYEGTKMNESYGESWKR